MNFQSESFMKMKPQYLEKYLSRSNLNDPLLLTENLTFHWADWDQTCMHQKSKLKKFDSKSNDQKQSNLEELNASLNELKKQNIWLSNKSNIIKSTLYDLYESYMDSRLRLTWFERQDEILFSYESEFGPFYTITSMKWMSKEVYSKFVYRKILTEHCMLRAFRLKTAIPLMLKLDKDFIDHSNKVQIHQISKHGLILKITDKNFMNKINFSRQMHFRIPISTLLLIAPKTLDETLEVFKKINWNSREEYLRFSLDTRIMNFYGNGKNFKHSPDNEFYVFARYEDFIPDDHRIELRPAFFHIVEKVYKKFEEEMKFINENSHENMQDSDYGNETLNIQKNIA
jgi:hypothetical protein